MAIVDEPWTWGKPEAKWKWYADYKPLEIDYSLFAGGAAGGIPITAGQWEWDEGSQRWFHRETAAPDLS